MNLTASPWSRAHWQQVQQKYCSERPQRRWHLWGKRWADLLLAGLGLVLIAPLLGVIAIAIRLSSPGPIFFVQERLGQYGQSFQIYKFRTMVDGAVRLGAGLDTFEGDPRVTAVGKVLREYHLDELPQLFNVLRGEMSLVGPRPLLPSSLATYQDWEKRRLLLPPGMTAWEAVQGGLLNTIDERIALDVWYVDHFTLWLDGWILLKTIPVVLAKEGVYGENGSEKGRESQSRA
ncbi:sugar transferase [Halomicronema sp. CCY15110]|uniref:sugar transferase n=1 Tax=Halomicronema sp. CCY15110 TaxID=2767773 RepID=UPI00195143FF|nr:sugar transferase [Halomicronema sp. CCY15110]